MKKMSKEIMRIKKVYNTTYRHDPKDRNYIWNPYNPVSVYYRQAQERVIVSLFKRFDLDFDDKLVLDVGCGNGSLLRFFVSLGMEPANLYGQDLMQYRVDTAKKLSPEKVNYKTCSAEKLPYPDNSFDLVSQFTVFSSILSSKIRIKIAQEMKRVLKPGGYIFWYDMRGGNSKSTRGIGKNEINLLFPSMERVAIIKLHSPYLSKIVTYSPFMAYMWDKIFFLKKTHYLILLKKPNKLKISH